MSLTSHLLSQTLKRREKLKKGVNCNKNNNNNKIQSVTSNEWKIYHSGNILIPICWRDEETYTCLSQAHLANSFSFVSFFRTRRNVLVIRPPSSSHPPNHSFPHDRLQGNKNRSRRKNYDIKTEQWFTLIWKTLHLERFLFGHAPIHRCNYGIRDFTFILILALEMHKNHVFKISIRTAKR